MRIKKLLAMLTAGALSLGLLAGCGNAKADGQSGSGSVGDAEVAAPAGENGEFSDDQIINFTMFAAMPNPEINDGNDIQEIIAKKTGVRVKETWLTGQTAQEAVGSIIASGDLPDYIDGGDGMMQLYDAGLLVAWDEYIEKYPNIKEMYTDAEWNQFRQEDGHIYWANVFQNTYGESTTTIHNDQAFWIQARVLEWAGYPKVETLDDYFKLLADYAAENPTMEDGTPVIPYTVLCEDWRYFCIENAPQFLDGYPNDGSVIVDVENMKIVDYNTTPTAKMYFGKLNEAYNNGLIDKDFATQTYDEYIAKLSTGRVLGMCDQWWDFAFTVNDIFKQQGLDKAGCDYVPLGLTAKAGMDQMWHTYGDTLNNSSGVAVTTSCKNPEAAFKFLNDVLDQEIHNLRFWGIEGEDYLVDDNGLFYRTEEMRTKWADTTFQAQHRCNYSYLPQWGGTSRDGKNAMLPQEQTTEFFDSLAEPLVKCFEAYGARNYPDMIGSVVKETGIWYPMYSHSNSMTSATPGGVAWTKMGNTKHEWLPKVVMSANFEDEWGKYMDAYSQCNPQDFLSEMQEELNRRVAMAQ